VKGDYIALLKKLGAELDRQAGRHLTINATGAIAALLLEIGLPVEIMRGIAVVSRAGGLTGHIVEERATHSGRHIWNLVEHAIPYEEPDEK
jgi:citrate synthase